MADDKVTALWIIPAKCLRMSSRSSAVPFNAYKRHVYSHSFTCRFFDDRIHTHTNWLGVSSRVANVLSFGQNFI